jgi:hypothetical protein
LSRGQSTVEHDALGTSKTAACAESSEGDRVSKYVRVADKKAQEHRDWLKAQLKQSAESGNTESLGKLADMEIIEQRAAARVGPLQEQIDQQTKTLREVRAELASTSEQLIAEQGRVAECDRQIGELLTEREGLKGDITQLGSRIVSLNDENIRALSAEAGTRRQLEAVKASAGKLRFSVATLAKHVNFSEGFIQELFFKFFDQLAPELFTDLGWSTEKIEFWSRWYSKSKNTASDKLIDLLHRHDCPCTGHGQQPTSVKDQDGLRPITEDDREFFKALLKSRGVDVDLEISKLVATHLEDWRNKNRPELRYTPPISHRELTPIAGARVVRWDED